MVLPLPLCLLKMDGVSVVIYQHAGTVVPLILGRPHSVKVSIQTRSASAFVSALLEVALPWPPNPAPGAQWGLWRCQLPLSSLSLLVAGGKI